MEHFSLSANETILYKGTVNVIENGKEKKRGGFKKISSQLFLTNFNLVLITKTKKLIGEDIKKEIYPISEIKIYEDAPQIIRDADFIDIYLLSAEIFLHFPNKRKAKEFTNKALRLITRNSKFVRAVKKAQKEIKETNEALDIDVVKIAKTVTAVSGQVIVDVSTSSIAGKKTKTLGAIASSIFSQKKLKKSSETENTEE